MNTFEIQLDIPGVVIEDTIITEDRIIIIVSSTVKGTCCRICGQKIYKPYGRGREIDLRHLSILGKAVYIRICPPRYQCIDCEDNPITTQTSPWYTQRSPQTRDYEDYVLLQLINSTVEDVSIKEGLGYEAVMGVIKRRIDTEVDWSEIERIDVIGLDEISLKKGHRDFVTIVSALCGEDMIILAILENREKKTVKKFLKTIPKRLRKKISGVCSDMYEGFINAAKEVFGKKTKIIIDRFHVAKLYRKGLEGIRKKEMKRLKNELPEKEYKKLKGAMWAVRKAPESLSEQEKEVLEILFKYSPVLKLAYDYCNQLTDIFEEDISKNEAKRKIKKWETNVRLSGLTCFNSFLSTLNKWLEDITNYFINRQTSGFVEGLNNKLKVIKRRCYGIINIKHLFQRTFLDFKGYSLFA